MKISKRLMATEMRSAPWKDIGLSWVSLAIWAFVALFAGPEPLLLALGMPLILFLPGYLLTSAVFPRRSQIDGLERLVLSLNLSIACVALLGLLLNYSPWKLRPLPMVCAMSVMLLALGVAAITARRLAGERVFHPMLPSGLRYSQEYGR